MSNKADAVVPAEYDLPLAEGWITGNGAVYQKTQDGMVALYAEIRLNDGESATDGALLATLPTGFRPRRYMIVPAVVQDSGSRFACAIQINASGSLIYNGQANTSSVFRIYLNCTFFTG